MEEERLVLLKEHKQSVESFQIITKEKLQLEDAKTQLIKENETMKKTITECENTLKQLKDDLDAQKVKLKLAKASSSKKKLATKKPQALKFKADISISEIQSEASTCMSCDKRAKTGEPVNKNLMSDNQLLTNELILANRELQNFKSDNKNL